MGKGNHGGGDPAGAAKFGVFVIAVGGVLLELVSASAIAHGDQSIYARYGGVGRKLVKPLVLGTEGAGGGVTTGG